MLKLIIGNKGSGKTKQLIEMVNAALDKTNGSVVCIEKGDKLRFDVKYQCRLIDTEAFGINGCCGLYGFVCGILASNNDVTDLYIDSALKVCDNDLEKFDKFVARLGEFAEKCDVNFVVTSSIAPEDASETVKKYL